jgi:hypothetical protein
MLTARWYGKLPSVSGLACVFAFMVISVDCQVSRNSGHDKIVKMKMQKP